MEDFIITALVLLVVGSSFAAGALYGRALEQKAAALTLAAFATVDADARTAVTRLRGAFPRLQKYL
jgi:hypothetical protein